MLSTKKSTLRDWGLFALIALLPAAAIGLLGLRALTNEEAAIKREMRVVLEQAVENARRAYETELHRLEQPGTTAPFADAVDVAPGAIQATQAPSPARDKTDCEALARSLSAAPSNKSVDKDAARRAIVERCATTRLGSGRWLWIVVALGEQTQVDAGRLESWLAEHAAQLSTAERVATRLDVQRASWLAPPDKDALIAVLTADEAHVEAPLAEAQRRAMRQGKPRIRWSETGQRGLLSRAADGSYHGFVVRPASLARALDEGWPGVPSDVATHLVVSSQPPPATAFEVLEGGAYVELGYADPGAVAERTSRSKRILLGVATLAVLIALALAALLFARMRQERRVSGLRTDFVAAVSHELRTPIASIRMLSELLADGHIDDANEQLEMHQALAREAKRLGDTVNRLLGFSRMEAGKGTLKLSLADVAPPVQEAISTAEERYPTMTIVREVDATIRAPIDAEAVKMAVTNLLNNAIKYAKAPFIVRVEREDDGVCISVEDSGPGLSKRDQKRIFKPFERADDRLSEATEGSGIGLSLVQHVARSHRGRAGVESELDRGSRFFLWLPVDGDAEKRIDP